MDPRVKQAFEDDLRVDWDVHHDPSGETESHVIIEDAAGVFHAMADEVAACNREKGWYDDERSVGEGIALLHSEVSEMLEAYRDHGTEDRTGFGKMIVDGKDHLTGEPIKPEGYGSEAADVLVRLLDECSRQGIDLFAEWRRKVTYNWTRPARHGGKKL